MEFKLNKKDCTLETVKTEPTKVVIELTEQQLEFLLIASDEYIQEFGNMSVE